MVILVVLYGEFYCMKMLTFATVLNRWGCQSGARLGSLT